MSGKPEPKGQSGEGVSPEAMAEHFENLFSRVSETESLNLERFQNLLPEKAQIKWDIGGVPTEAEVREAIEKLNCGSSAIGKSIGTRFCNHLASRR